VQGPIVQQRLITIIAALGCAACDPPAENAGELEPTESGTGSEAGGSDGGSTVTDAADGSSETGELPPEATVEWALELGPDDLVTRMLRSPAGVVVAVQGDPAAPTPSSEVREYSSSMDLLWSHALVGGGIADLDALDDGEYLAVGSVLAGATSSPTAWRLSCCADVVTQTYPQSGEHSSIVVAERNGDGILLGIQDDAPVPYLMQVPLDLTPSVAGDSLPARIYGGATTPAGNVLLRLDAGDVDMFYEIEEDGSGSGFGFGGTTVLVGTGDELTFMTFGEDEVEIQPFGDDAWVTVPIPGFTYPYDELVLDRHERLVLVHHELDAEGPVTLYLTELGEDGVVARTLAIPHMQYEFASASGVAVGEDGAIYLAALEHDGEGASASYLLRIAPL
jgi:hypothetical protein